MSDDKKLVVAQLPKNLKDMSDEEIRAYVKGTLGPKLRGERGDSNR